MRKCLTFSLHMIQKKRQDRQNHTCPVVCVRPLNRLRNAQSRRLVQQLRIDRAGSDREHQKESEHQERIRGFPHAAAPLQIASRPQEAHRQQQNRSGQALRTGQQVRSRHIHRLSQQEGAREYQIREIEQSQKRWPKQPSCCDHPFGDGDLSAGWCPAATVRYCC